MLSEVTWASFREVTRHHIDLRDVAQEPVTVEELDRAEDVLVGASAENPPSCRLPDFRSGSPARSASTTSGNPENVSNPMTRRWKLYGSRMADSLAKLSRPPPKRTPHSTMEPCTSKMSLKIS